VREEAAEYVKGNEDRVRLLLKAEIKRADISYEELGARLI
jgi:hypothetical protein